LKALEQFHQVVKLHRQLELGAGVVLGPADLHQQAEVVGELQAELFGFGVVLLALQRVPEVAYGADVIAEQFVEPAALLAVDLDNVQGVLRMELGGFEPPTSWVRSKLTKSGR
jgi:hypothetical protein